MRFNSVQLRMLQESLAPSLPTLSTPPEMVASHAAAPTHALHQHAAQEVSRQTTLVGWLVLFVYMGCLWAAALAGNYWLWHVRVLAASPLPLALAAHALFAAHSRPAQALGLASAVLLPVACACPWPNQALLWVAALSSAFFSASTQGSALLRSGSAALTLLLFFLACCAVFTEARPVRVTISLVIAVVIFVQAGATALRAGSFRLVCAVVR